MQAACDAHARVAPYEKYKAWCDEYFFLKHRQEARGIGGIFYDWHDSGDWDADLAFTKAVGRALLKAYPELVRRNYATAWSEASARSSWCGAAATSSSISSTTAARCSV